MLLLSQIMVRQVLWRGITIGCGTIIFDAASPSFAETNACRLGMELGKRLHFSNIIIEGDASNVTDAVLGDTREHPMEYIICGFTD